MSLLGGGIIALWNDIVPEGRDEFYEWHNREHLPERVAIPGFIRSRRYIAREGLHEYFILHEAETTDVLVGAEYLERLNNPTLWTQKIIPTYFRNMSRGVCRVSYSESCGDGAYLAILQFGPHLHRESELEAALREHVLPPIGNLAGVVGVHLGITEVAASEVEAAERKGLSTEIPKWLVMIEGSGEQLAAAAGNAITASDLARHGATGEPERALYAMQFAKLKTNSVDR